MQQDKPIINPYAAIFIAVLSVSTSAIFVKVSSAPASIIATYRLLFAVLFMSPWLLVNYRSQLKRIRKKDFWYCTLAGVFLAFHFILWFESLNYTSVASSVVLVTLQPLFAFIGTYLFFKEKLSFGAITGGILAIIGSFVISWGDFQVSGMALIGDVLALLACAMVTGYLLFGQNVRKRLDLIPYTFLVYGMAVATLVIYDLIIQVPLVGYPAKDWTIFVLLALFPTLLGHSIFNWVVKWISVSVISMSILGEPIGASILAYFILGEKIHASQMAGGFVILSGIFIFLRFHRHQSKKARVNQGKTVQQH
ncbi:DMT family transporter [Pseudalkalibacillus caeni]|uniref:DMT family transporter n=1 Tax=Exobacillus caeni TaxID=2574798 RepID=A0A5R9F2Q2_9BACL|nr:DMT family transporter [Pseudalkalibacillus caeni]TLS36586.1 DMT family transporter [Pseudalkalibacillus caeni]